LQKTQLLVTAFDDYQLLIHYKILTVKSEDFYFGALIVLLYLCCIKNTYTEDQKQGILFLYKNGMSVKNIGRSVGLGRKAIFNFIEKNVPNKRDKSEGQRARHGTFIKEDAFDILSPEALYWIGFLYADGGIEAARPIVALGIAECDKPHLEKYNKFLGGNLNIGTYTNSNKHLKGCNKEDSTICRISYSNKRIHDRLLELGFNSNKSSYILPNSQLINSRDFWRGVIDGDGWIGKYEREDCNKLIETIGLSGTELTLIEFINFINNSGIKCGTTPHKDKRGNVWKVELHSTIAKQVMNLLYKDASVYLDRKYQTYLAITQNVV
jgi:hypothetical protein